MDADEPGIGGGLGGSGNRSNVAGDEDAAIGAGTGGIRAASQKSRNVQIKVMRLRCEVRTEIPSGDFHTIQPTPARRQPVRHRAQFRQRFRFVGLGADIHHQKMGVRGHQLIVHRQGGRFRRGQSGGDAPGRAHSRQNVGRFGAGPRFQWHALAEGLTLVEGQGQSCRACGRLRQPGQQMQGIAVEHPLDRSGSRRDGSTGQCTVASARGARIRSKWRTMRSAMSSLG